MTNSVARLYTRLNLPDKSRIARAADLRGVPLLSCDEQTEIDCW